VVSKREKAEVKIWKGGLHPLVALAGEQEEREKEGK